MHPEGNEMFAECHLVVQALVPPVGVEPTRPHGQGTPSLSEGILTDLTKIDDLMLGETSNRQRHALVPTTAHRVPEKLSQHRHQKDRAPNVAVVSSLISLGNGGSREG